LNAAGVQEILYEGINPGEKDYSAIVGKLKAVGAEVLYYGGYPTEGGLILRQAADPGVKFQSRRLVSFRPSSGRSQVLLAKEPYFRFRAIR
jgi:ABC-type branched-subunit amino acid transport system substrate-binding protein